MKDSNNDPEAREQVYQSPGWSKHLAGTLGKITAEGFLDVIHMSSKKTRFYDRCLIHFLKIAMVIRCFFWYGHPHRYTKNRPRFWTDAPLLVICCMILLDIILGYVAYFCCFFGFPIHGVFVFLSRSQLSWREAWGTPKPLAFRSFLPVFAMFLGRLIVSLWRTSSHNCPGCISRLETMLSDLALFGWVPASKSRSLWHSGSHCRLRASHLEGPRGAIFRHQVASAMN